MTTTNNPNQIRVIAGVLDLKRFSVATMCEHVGLRRSQVDPVLSSLKKQGFIKWAEASEPSQPAAHRPPGMYEITSDPHLWQKLADTLYLLRKAMIKTVPSEPGLMELRVIETALRGLEVLLAVCKRRSKNLEQDDLYEIEQHLQEVYGYLEAATYETSIDLNAQWQRWGCCSDDVKALRVSLSSRPLS